MLQIPCPGKDTEGLGQSSDSIQNPTDERREPAEERLEKMCGAVRTLLECMGEDPHRYRVDIDSIINGAVFCEGHDEMIMVKDIDIHSLCEHHLIPFTGKMHIGYVSSGAVIGLSKLPRIAEIASRRLQIQERLTKHGARMVMDVLQPQGVAVVMEASHLCMEMRGVEKKGSTTVTSCVLGCFKERDVYNEFLRVLGIN
ncbi:hypothetical protein B0A55_09531 [Friedmanniomyces simplex]|uniref:GTP cyclohydrolase 1 n=1 Tax=Friedmanniomyces simplex TaxID=329884 RepID=A0A4U0XAR9_9PEZI|nr:hypothetical protein B0A55_09531 [Friedmanniomyces simplex]